MSQESVEVLGVAPILPSRNLTATSEFYARLGFEEQGRWPDEYLIVKRGEAGLHFFHSALSDPWASDGNLLRIGSFITEPG
jgi:hypothetical protein